MNLLLVSIDSLRLDFVSRTHPEIHTPQFDEQVQGYGFSDRCFSVSSATRPVHASIFTGLYPFEHGVLGQRSPRLRAGIPHLFELFSGQGWKVGGFSEASEIFSGLSFSSAIAPLAPQAGEGLRQLERFLQRPPAVPTFLFVHYWSTHTPYGAADGKAFGEIGRLLRAGRVDQVREYYARAVEELCTHKLAPLLSRLDQRQWCIFIFSDHGQSWTAEEPYHGRTLKNSVLRVPLYWHIPFTGNPVPARPLISLIDLFPTLTTLFALPVDYRGGGRDLTQGDSPDYYLAQLEPLPPGRSDLEIIGDDRVEQPGLQWALFDATEKFTYFVDRRQGIIEHPWTEEPLVLDDQERYVERFSALQKASPYAALSPEQGAGAQKDQLLLDQRLRALGYLD